MSETEGRMVILVNKNMSRGKQAAHAVHVALDHYGHTDHGAVIVLQESPTRIKEQALDGVFFQDQGRTEVEPGTVTACVKSFEEVETPEAYTGLAGEATKEIAVEKALKDYRKASLEESKAFDRLYSFTADEQRAALNRIQSRGEVI